MAREMLQQSSTGTCFISLGYETGSQRPSPNPHLSPSLVHNPSLATRLCLSLNPWQALSGPFLGNPPSLQGATPKKSGSLKSGSLFCCSLPQPRASSSPQFSASEPCLPRAPAQMFLLLPVPRSGARPSLVPACDHPSAPLLTGLSGPLSVVLPRSRRVSQSVVQPPVGYSLRLCRRLPVGPNLCCFRRLPVGPNLSRPCESAFGSTLILTSAITPLKSLPIHPSWIPMNICTHFSSKL